MPELTRRPTKATKRVKQKNDDERHGKGGQAK
jgi:hypothetical protein